jgi:hypothetical protein
LCKKKAFSFTESHDRGGYPAWVKALQKTGGSGHVFEVESIDHLLETLGRNVHYCECVEKLTIFMHGATAAAGGFRIAQPPRNRNQRVSARGHWDAPRNYTAVESFGFAIKPVMCNECGIAVISCKGGRGLSFQVLANSTGCSVRGTKETPDIYSWGTFDPNGQLLEYSPGGNPENPKAVPWTPGHVW